MVLGDIGDVDINTFRKEVWMVSVCPHYQSVRNSIASFASGGCIYLYVCNDIEVDKFAVSKRGAL